MNLTGRAYESLRRDILSGRLNPGSPLRIVALAKELDVSMSVVREALTRLAGKGLVVALPNQGFRVVALSREDLMDLTRLRVDLECMAFARSIELGDVRWEAAMVAAHHILERTPLHVDGSSAASEEWIDAHAAFHDALGAGCGSPRLIALVHSLRDSAEVYRQWAGPRIEETDRDIAGEHRQLMELATARDTDAGLALLTAHITRTSDALLAVRCTGALQ